MRLMAIVDVINKVYGRDTLVFAVQGDCPAVEDEAGEEVVSVYDAVGGVVGGELEDCLSAG